MINLKRLCKSFKFAFRGIIVLLEKEQNFAIHVITGIVVILAGIFFHLRAWEWIVIILLISLVFVLEMLNTVFERLMDMLKPRMHQYVAEIKDISSAMVLVAAISSIIIGLTIFIPHLLELF